MDGLAKETVSGATNRSSSLPTPPGSNGLPVVGETLDYLRSPATFIEARRAKYGPIFFSRLLGKQTIFMAGAESIHWICAGEGKYLEHEHSPARHEPLGPHLRGATMDAAIPALLTVARKHMRRWQSDAELGHVAMIPRVRSLVFEITANCLFGETGDLGLTLDQFREDFEICSAGMHSVVALPIPGTSFARALAARKRMFTILDDLVMRRDASDRRGPDVLSTLLDLRDEHDAMLPRETIVDELHLLLFAAQDPTVTAISNVIDHLAKHPEIAQEARAEQDQLPEHRFTRSSTSEMPYLDAVIKESMRVTPPTTATFRVMTRDAEFGGFRMPKGWRIALSPHLVHFESQHYPEPRRFDPSRWLEPHTRPASAYVPFGGEARSCIGQDFAELEMLILLAMLLRDFEWTRLPDLSGRVRARGGWGPSPLPRDGLMLDLRRRDSGILAR